jgi:L-rhamnose-H+ transport protein
MVLGASLKGIVAVTVAGLSNGSFPAPSKGMRYWKWEHIWLVYSLCAMCLLPVGLGAIFAHGMIARLVGRDIVLAAEVCVFGALWGLGSLLFGVSLPRLGMAITNALVSGTLVFLGSLGPIVTGAVQIDLRHLLWLVGGLSLLAASLALCASAAVSRDRARGLPSSKPGTPSRSLWAVLIAFLAGVLSSMLNLGFVVGAPLARNALSEGTPRLLASVAIWIPALLGGLLLNVGYPVYLIWRRRSWDLLVSGPEWAGSWLRSSLMGVLWFGAILLYGYGASMMGREGAVYGWALIVAMSIFTSNTWGVVMGEWKGSGRKPKMLMWFSTAVLVSSFVILSTQRQAG